MIVLKEILLRTPFDDSCTLTETDLGTELDLDSKPDGYIVQCEQTQTQIPTAYFCVGHESESESVLESVSGNGIEP